MLRRRKEHQFWICADAWFERLLHRVVPCQGLPTNLLSPNYVSPDVATRIDNSISSA
jgi:hypothetical protein